MQINLPPNDSADGSANDCPIHEIGKNVSNERDSRAHGTHGNTSQQEKSDSHIHEVQDCQIHGSLSLMHHEMPFVSNRPAVITIKLKAEDSSAAQSDTTEQPLINQDWNRQRLLPYCSPRACSPQSPCRMVDNQRSTHDSEMYQDHQFFRNPQLTLMSSVNSSGFDRSNEIVLGSNAYAINNERLCRTHSEINPRREFLEENEIYTRNLSSQQVHSCVAKAPQVTFSTKQAINSTHNVGQSTEEKNRPAGKRTERANYSVADCMHWDN